MRINRALAAAGVASRRGAEELIRAGRVRLNGELVSDLATTVDLVRDELSLDGRILSISTESFYYAYYKPRGMVCTMQDERQRGCVGDICRELKGHPSPVGRLDRASEGLLLLTNDGELANRLMHPRYGVEKGYLATVKPELTDLDAGRLTAGIELDDGSARFLEISLLERTRDRSRVQVTVAEGRNRLIRRCFESLGYSVHRLKRLSVGGLSLGKLQPGKFRQLASQEIGALKRLVGL